MTIELADTRIAPGRHAVADAVMQRGIDAGAAGADGSRGRRMRRDAVSHLRSEAS